MDGTAPQDTPRHRSQTRRLSTWWAIGAVVAPLLTTGCLNSFGVQCTDDDDCGDGSAYVCVDDGNDGRVCVDKDAPPLTPEPDVVDGGEPEPTDGGEPDAGDAGEPEPTDGGTDGGVVDGGTNDGGVVDGGVDGGVEPGPLLPGQVCNDNADCNNLDCWELDERAGFKICRPTPDTGEAVFCEQPGPIDTFQTVLLCPDGFQCFSACIEVPDGMAHDGEACASDADCAMGVCVRAIDDETGICDTSNWLFDIGRTTNSSETLLFGCSIFLEPLNRDVDVCAANCVDDNVADRCIDAGGVCTDVSTPTGDYNICLGPTCNEEEECAQLSSDVHCVPDVHTFIPVDDGNSRCTFGSLDSFYGDGALCEPFDDRCYGSCTSLSSSIGVCEGGVEEAGGCDLIPVCDGSGCRDTCIEVRRTHRLFNTCSSHEDCAVGVCHRTEGDPAGAGTCDFSAPIGAAGMARDGEPLDDNPTTPLPGCMPGLTSVVFAGGRSVCVMPCDDGRACSELVGEGSSCGFVVDEGGTSTTIEGVCSLRSSDCDAFGECTAPLAHDGQGLQAEYECHTIPEFHQDGTVCIDPTAHLGVMPPLPPSACEWDTDCNDAGMICDPVRGQCVVSCQDNAGCGEQENCLRFDNNGDERAFCVPENELVDCDGTDGVLCSRGKHIPGPIDCTPFAGTQRVLRVAPHRFGGLEWFCEDTGTLPFPGNACDADATAVVYDGNAYFERSAICLHGTNNPTVADGKPFSLCVNGEGCDEGATCEPLLGNRFTNFGRRWHLGAQTAGPGDLNPDQYIVDVASTLGVCTLPCEADPGDGSNTCLAGVGVPYGPHVVGLSDTVTGGLQVPLSWINGLTHRTDPTCAGGAWTLFDLDDSRQDPLMHCIPQMVGMQTTVDPDVVVAPGRLAPDAAMADPTTGWSFTRARCISSSHEVDANIDRDRIPKTRPVGRAFTCIAPPSEEPVSGITTCGAGGEPTVLLNGDPICPSAAMGLAEGTYEMVGDLNKVDPLLACASGFGNVDPDDQKLHCYSASDWSTCVSTNQCTSCNVSITGNLVTNAQCTSGTQPGGGMCSSAFCDNETGCSLSNDGSSMCVDADSIVWPGTTQASEGGYAEPCVHLNWQGRDTCNDTFTCMAQLCR